jgi:uncharacterized protein (TIGR02996 family)
MTNEDDFQAALDARPDDWQTRLVFADFLADRGDPRADGYRALGTLRKRAFVCGFDNKAKTAWKGAAWFGRNLASDEEAYDLPQDWFDAINDLGEHETYKPRYETDDAEHADRRAVEDAAARAFGKLPAPRRAELLASVPLAEPTNRRREDKPKEPKKPKKPARKPKKPPEPAEPPGSEGSEE